MSEKLSSNIQIKMLIIRLETRLKDTEELLARWREEALVSRSVMQAMVDEEISLETARKILAVTDPAKIDELRFVERVNFE